MSRIITLPEPPFYAVIAPAALGPDSTGHAEMAARVMESSRLVHGFLGIETCVQPGFSLAVSYWDSLDAIDTWRRHPDHRLAKEAGKSRWFTGYATRIAHVIDQY
jgi:heme-degrading monooxygenase HmoA